MSTHGDPSETLNPGSAGISRSALAAAVFGATGVLLATFDPTALGVALPTIADDLGIDVQDVLWVTLVTIIVTGALLLGAGRLADLVGRKKVFLYGVAIFFVGSTISAFSQNLLMLIAGRAVIGIGAAALNSMGPALIVGAFPPESRGRALGVVGTVTSVGLVSGPILSGFIVDGLGWHAMFFVEMPIAALMIVGGLVFLSESERIKGEGFDILGTVLMIGWTAPLLFAITQGRSMGWTSLPILGLGAAGVALLAAFIYSQKKVRFPMVDLSLFRIRSFRLPMSASFFGFAALTSTFLLIPFYLEDVLGLSVKEVGLISAVLPGMMVFIAIVAGRVSDRIGPRIPSTFGLALMAVGIFNLGLLGAESSIPRVVAAMAIGGAGLGSFEWTLNSAIVGSLPRSKLGVASGFLATARTLGFSTGQAAWATLFTVVVTMDAGTEVARQSPVESMELGFRIAFFAAAGVALLAALLAWLQGPVTVRD
ncbi:MAG: MFS transporter [Chloroflexota bacterium]|jgi:EmrB/QacA subfamily drug resistance transporter|nr:MFS transporter [Chloroflexota bacterium]MDP6758043.1 MFS transporter [Chloroflexota bacterium]